MTSTKPSSTIPFNLRPLNKLRNLSWIIVFCSVIIDISHVRAFPSYNIIIGLWACYCGHYQNEMLAKERRKKKRKTKNRSRQSHLDAVASGGVEELIYLQKLISSYAVITSMSVIIDILFCSIWGEEIFDGDYPSLKFSLVIFIINMFVKIASTFFALQIVYGVDKQSESSLSRYESPPQDDQLKDGEIEFARVPSLRSGEQHYSATSSHNNEVESPAKNSGRPKTKGRDKRSLMIPDGLEMEEADYESSDEDIDEDDDGSYEEGDEEENDEYDEEYENMEYHQYYGNDVEGIPASPYRMEQYSNGVPGLISPGTRVIPNGFPIPATPPPPPPPRPRHMNLRTN